MRSMRRKRPWRRVLIYACLFVGLYLGACYGLARLYLGPRRSNPSMPKGAVAVEIPGQPFAVPTWVSANVATAPVVFVCVHGYGGSRNAWRELLTHLPQHGYGVVVPALPGHDVSPDETRGFGSKESHVVIETVD